MIFLLYFSISLIVWIAIITLAAPFLFRPSPGERRIISVATTSRSDARKIGARERLVNAMIAASRLLRSQLKMSDDNKLRHRLASAGLRSSRSMEIYFVFRVASPFFGIALGSLFSSNMILACVVGAFIGYAIPDFGLTHLATRRKDRMRRGIPDAIDLMVICVDAGLGVDQALLKVGQELAITHPALSQELLRVNMEQRAGKPRADAWRSLAERTQIPEFDSFVNMLVQTDRFGTPIIRALSRFAGEIRARRRQKAEEAAAKTKVKILFPLVLFIFPIIFIVLLGPPLLNMVRSFNF